MKVLNLLRSLISEFGRMNRILLLFLIAFPFSISITDPNPTTINYFLKNFSSICLFCWVCSIVYISMDTLNDQSFKIKIKKYADLLISIIVFSFLLLVVTDDSFSTSYNSWKIEYSKPLFFSLLVILAYTGLLLMAAKALVSAEKKSEASFKEYFSTSLLVLFAIIGLWSIQPRLQKLENGQLV